MKKEVRLTISGLHSVGEAGEDNVETVVKAEYFERGGSHYLFYQEKSSEGVLSSDNRIKFRDRLLELNRRGGLETRMVFEEGKSYTTSYATPYGSLLLDIHTKSVQVRREKDSILVQVQYRLDAEKAYLADSCITLKIEELSA